MGFQGKPALEYVNQTMNRTSVKKTDIFLDFLFLKHL